MTPERAIEILNPEHREHYDSIETVNEACRMGMRALKKQLPGIEYCGIGVCPCCNEIFFDKSKKYCCYCGQALLWINESEECKND